VAGERSEYDIPAENSLDWATFALIGPTDESPSECNEKNNRFVAGWLLGMS
jgi:hypothetical protein